MNICHCQIPFPDILKFANFSCARGHSFADQRNLALRDGCDKGVHSVLIFAVSYSAFYIVRMPGETMQGKTLPTWGCCSFPCLPTWCVFPHRLKHDGRNCAFASCPNIPIHPTLEKWWTRFGLLDYHTRNNILPQRSSLISPCIPLPKLNSGKIFANHDKNLVAKRLKKSSTSERKKFNPSFDQ